jgi:hypothetical protein
VLVTNLLRQLPNNGRYLPTDGCRIAAFFAVVMQQRVYMPQHILRKHFISVLTVKQFCIWPTDLFVYMLFSSGMLHVTMEVESSSETVVLI